MTLVDLPHPITPNIECNKYLCGNWIRHLLRLLRVCGNSLDLLQSSSWRVVFVIVIAVEFRTLPNAPPDIFEIAFCDCVARAPMSCSLLLSPPPPPRCLSNKIGIRINFRCENGCFCWGLHGSAAIKFGRRNTLFAFQKKKEKKPRAPGSFCCASSIWIFVFYLSSILHSLIRRGRALYILIYRVEIVLSRWCNQFHRVVCQVNSCAGIKRMPREMEKYEDDEDDDRDRHRVEEDGGKRNDERRKKNNFSNKFMSIVDVGNYVGCCFCQFIKIPCRAKLTRNFATTCAHDSRIRIRWRAHCKWRDCSFVSVCMSHWHQWPWPTNAISVTRELGLCELWSGLRRETKSID